LNPLVLSCWEPYDSKKKKMRITKFLWKFSLFTFSGLSSGCLQKYWFDCAKCLFWNSSVPNFVDIRCEVLVLLDTDRERHKLNSVALVRERTIPTERTPLVGEVSAPLTDRECHVVSVTNPYARILWLF
jgi:hypothetical protein